MLVKIYNQSPSPREIGKVASALSGGGIAIIPTDTLYAFVCLIDQKHAVERLAQLKGFSTKQARYSLLCSSISQLSEHVRPMPRDLYALVRQCLPGPFTFIMDANNNVPRHIVNANHTIGMRVPDNSIAKAIIEAVGKPLVSTSVRRINVDDDDENLTDPDLMHSVFERQTDIVVDGGMGELEPSTVVDCSAGGFEIVRQGKGIIKSE